MTSDELRDWRWRLAWSLDEAATALGLSRRAYIYLETGRTSAGAQRAMVPRYIELATAELEHRVETGRAIE